MSLDQNLFTLLFIPNTDHPNVTDLVDPSGTVHYYKRRVAGAEYKIEIFDPMSESLLITATAPSTSSKTKTLELFNPTGTVEFKSIGTMLFKWAFKWEEHEFEWRREECHLIRKPDPPVLVAITKEASRQNRTTQVQILDYNLNRFEIDDRKGLEIIMLTALMTFHDAKEVDTTSPISESSPSSFSLSRMMSTAAFTSAPAVGGTVTDAPPLRPPKPAPKTGLDRITEMQALKGEDYNEITVEDEGIVDEYAQYCNSLLSDDAMLFISIKSSSAEHVTKVLQVVEETKRIRYKAGLDEETELHQYVLYDIEKQKGPKRINLNDDADKKDRYKPPSSLVVHLSKIDMPELQPKSQPMDKSKKSVNKGKTPVDKGKKKEDKKVNSPSSLSTESLTSFEPAPIAASSSKEKAPKNKLARINRDKSPNDKSQFDAPAPRPLSGLFNYRPSQPSNSSSTLSKSSKPSRHPSPNLSTGGGYETPGLGLFNSYGRTPTPTPPGAYPPTPPTPPPSNSTPSKSLAVVTGLFEKMKTHRV